MTLRRGRALFLALAVVSVGVAAALSPIPQPAAYHGFADVRTILGVPNALNVLSNVAFLGVGLVGMRRAVASASARMMILFAGVTGTAFGSAAYHLAPTDGTLVWDRLPMTVAFMALLGVVVEDRLTGRRDGLFAALILLGAASVLYWRVTDDLRLYGLVQFFPMLALPFLLWVGPGGLIRGRDLVPVLGWYALAKAAEHFDGAIFGLGGIVSGHSLKHLLAALAAAAILTMLQPWMASVPVSRHDSRAGRSA